MPSFLSRSLSFSPTRFIFLLSLLFSFSAVNAADKTILIMGDSLSAAYGIGRERAWPVLLGERLKQQKLPYTIANASISGETTAGGRSRLANELSRHTPAIVVIELGANDGLRGLSLKQMRDNLEAMIQASQNAGARVMLIGMRMPPNFGQAYTEKFHATFVELSKAHRTALAPFMFEGFAEKREMFQNDGIHPLAEAQPLILENVWPALKPLLK